ncbi:MAG TPA: NAD+ synthase [Mycobacteriales bacterium]|nr:NAD+ synthase [Mycobacteriales bacterium]
MAQLRVALAQIDLTVGDLTGNTDLVVRWTRHAAGRGAHLVLFPEMALTGYPPEDLVLRRSFVEASRAGLERLAGRLVDEGVGDVAVVVGYLDRNPDPTPMLGRPAGEPQNASAFVHGGRVVASYAKHHLPNYGVFDEFRYFVPGDTLPVIRLHGVDIAMTICEDLWQEGGPIVAARAAGAGLVVCINGSPYERAKEDFRVALARRRAAQAGATLAYVNLVGGQDELVFDGGSLVVDARGSVLGRAPQFTEGCLLVDLDLPLADRRDDAIAVDVGDGTTMTVSRLLVSESALPPYPPEAAGVAARLPEDAEVYTALVTGTRDYARKNGFTTVVVGLSGGIDSALTATIAADALGPGAVHVVGLPSRYSSEHSLLDAEDLARRQGLHWQQMPIAGIVDGYEKAFADAGGLHGLAEENLQARIRGTILMALSNEAGHLVLTTGNKSELATGFSTLYGDSAGGFAPLKDVPKTLVWQLARWRNAHAAEQGLPAPIPESSITKAPSAELAPDQLDADRLPDYAVLDEVLELYVSYDRGRGDLLAAGHDPGIVDRVIRLVDTAEYKRRQYPPGPKISLKAFGRDRRLPITNSWREPAGP